MGGSYSLAYYYLWMPRLLLLGTRMIPSSCTVIVETTMQNGGWGVGGHARLQVITFGTARQHRSYRLLLFEAGNDPPPPHWGSHVQKNRGTFSMGYIVITANVHKDTAREARRGKSRIISAPEQWEHVQNEREHMDPRSRIL